MICPKCHHDDTRVVDSREANGNREIRRRRECEKCKHRFTTFERRDSVNLIVVKKDGSRQPYQREKIETGVWKACQKRLVTQAQVDQLINELESEWLSKAQDREIESKVIGESIMKKLKNIDQVAYIRFASVYRSFQDIDSFHREIDRLAATK